MAPDEFHQNPAAVTASGTHARFPSGENRLAAVLAIVLALVGAAVAGVFAPVSASGDGSSYGGRTAVREAPASAATSSWYCAGPSAIAGISMHAISVVDTTRQSRTVTIESISDSGTVARGAPFVVNGQSQAGVAGSTLASGAYDGADVQVSGGGVSAFETVAGPGGQSVLPCASGDSSRWYLTGGDTLGQDRVIYILYNPSSTDAIVDIGLFTEAGGISDPQDQGIYVPAGHIVAHDVTARVFGSALVAATVTCRLGRVVSYQLLLRPPPGSAPGTNAPVGSGAVSLSLGAPSLANSWTFPEGVSSPEEPEDLTLFNPTSTASTAKLSVSLEAGTAEPVTIPVPASSVVDFAVNSVATRIPAHDSHVVTVTVVKGGQIVVSQTTGTPPPPTDVTQAGAGNQSSVPWLAQFAGATGASSDWVVGGIPATQPPGLTVVVENPSSGRVTVSVSVLSPDNAALSPVPAQGIGPGGHFVFQVPVDILTAGTQAAGTQVGNGSSAPPRAIVVHGDGPVVVEAQTYSAQIPGYSASLGVPGAGQ